MRERSLVQLLAAITAVVFLVLGILGFVPGVTPHDAKLFGVFQVSTLHNIVHLAFGAVGLVLAWTAEGARTFLVVGGVACLALWVLGVVGAAGWIPANAADNWLHFVLGVGMIGLGYVGSRRAPQPVPA